MSIAAKKFTRVLMMPALMGLFLAAFFVAVTTVPASAAKTNKHSVAVIIGNKNYVGKTPQVDFAHNDADAIKRYVVDVLGYREGNIIDLRDATKADIEATFGNNVSHQGRLFDWVRPGKSDVFIFYSGHGVPGLKNHRPYLLAVDSDANQAEITGYPVDMLYANLAKLPAKSISVMLDACFSGETPKGMIVRATSGLSISAKLPDVATKSKMTVLTAAKGDQFASWDEDAKHGLFTRYLLDALYGAADSKGFGNGDGQVTLAEVRTYLNDEMTYSARRTWAANRKPRSRVMMARLCPTSCPVAARICTSPMRPRHSPWSWRARRRSPNPNRSSGSPPWPRRHRWPSPSRSIRAGCSESPFATAATGVIAILSRPW